MANPPITIGPFTNVPAPGSPIKSDWPQSLTQYAVDLAARLNAAPVEGNFSPATNMDAFAGGTWGSWLEVSLAVPSWATSAIVHASLIGCYAADANSATYEIALSAGAGGSSPKGKSAYMSNPTGSTGQGGRFAIPFIDNISMAGLQGGTRPFSIWAKRVAGTGFWRADVFTTLYVSAYFRPPAP